MHVVWTACMQEENHRCACGALLFYWYSARLKIELATALGKVLARVSLYCISLDGNYCATTEQLITVCVTLTPLHQCAKTLATDRLKTTPSYDTVQVHQRAQTYTTELGKSHFPNYSDRMPVSSLSYAQRTGVLGMHLINYPSLATCKPTRQHTDIHSDLRLLLLLQYHSVVR